MSSRKSSSKKMGPAGSAPLAATPFVAAVMGGADPAEPVIPVSSARSPKRSRSNSMSKGSALGASADAIRMANTPAALNAAPTSASVNALIGSLTLSSPLRVPSPVRSPVAAMATPQKILTAEEKLMGLGAVPTSVVIVRPSENRGRASALYLETVFSQPAGSRALVLLDDDSMVGLSIQQRATQVRSSVPVVFENVKAEVHPITSSRLNLLTEMPANVLGVGAYAAGQYVHALHRGGSSSLVRTPAGKIEEVVMTVEADGNASKTATITSPHLGQDLYSSVKASLPIVSLSTLLSKPNETMNDIAKATRKIQTASASVLANEVSGLTKASAALSAKSKALGESINARQTEMSRAFESTLKRTESKLTQGLSQLAALDTAHARLAQTGGEVSMENAAKAAAISANIAAYSRLLETDLPKIASAFISSSTRVSEISAKMIDEAENAAKGLMEDQVRLLEVLKAHEEVAGFDLASTSPQEVAATHGSGALKSVPLSSVKVM